MFLEKQLRKEFHKKANSIQSPAKMEGHILQLFEQHYPSNQEKQHKRRSHFSIFPLKKAA